MKISIKKLAAALIFFSAIFSASAQDISEFPLDEKSKPVFEKVCQKISDRPIVTGNFEQTKILAKLQRQIKSSGTFIISAEDGLLWKTTKPFPSAMAITDSAIIQTSKSGNKSVLDSSGNETFEKMSKIISSVFKGDAKTLEENFEIYFMGTSSNWTMELLPLDESLSAVIQSIFVAGDSTIKSVWLKENESNSVRYEFSAHNFPTALSPEEKSYFSK